MRYILTVLLSTISLISISAQSSISGSVHDEKQKQLKSFTVLLLKQSDSSLVKSTLTNENAGFSFKTVADGNYLILANGMGYQKTIAKLL